MQDTTRASRHRDTAFVAALVALSIFRSGFGWQPNRRFFATTFVDALPGLPQLRPFNQWALWSPIGPIAARILGLHSVRGFVALHVVVVLAGLGVLVIGVRRQYGSIAMRAALLAFVALPISVVVQSWLGNYDAWTFLLSTILVVTRSWKIATVAGFCLAFANFEQGAFMLMLLALVAVMGVHGSWRRCACAAAGLGAGRIALGIWLTHNHVTHGRLDYQRHLGRDYLLSAAGRSWALLALSLLGAAVILVWCTLSGERRQSYVVLIVLLVSILPMVLGADETRIYALTTWPPLLALILAETARSPERIRRAIRPTLALAAIVPGWFVWDGNPYLADFHWIRIFWRH